MTKHADITAALEQLTIEGALRPSWTVRGDEVDVGEGNAMPDATEIAAALDRAIAAREKQSRIESVPTELLALFSTLSEDTQAKWYDAGKVAAVRGALEHGKPGVARRLIASAAVLPRSEEDAVKKRMLALFDFPRGT